MPDDLITRDEADRIRQEAREAISRCMDRMTEIVAEILPEESRGVGAAFFRERAEAAAEQSTIGWLDSTPDI